MADHLYKVVVNLSAFSALPEDDVQNTFYFESESADSVAGDVTALGTAMAAFYNTDPSGGANGPLSNWIGEQISRDTDVCSMIVYAHDPGVVSGLWGSPVGVHSWTLGAAVGTTPYPSEVAAVLSFHGDLTNIPQTAPGPPGGPPTIRPAARRRGRVFFGPLTNITGSEDPATHEIVLGTGFKNAVGRFGRELALLFDAGHASYHWVVASGADNTTYQIVNGWVDDSFDTQRRRGQDRGGRTPWM